MIFEFYSGLSLRKREIFEKTELLFSKFRVFELNEEIAKIAAKINRENRLYGQIGAVDLLIGATTKYLAGYLATKNTKDFKLIPGLKLFPNLS